MGELSSKMQSLRQVKCVL